MVWKLEVPWQIGLEHAQKYFQENGHLAVPNNYICADGYRLGKWISNQRYAFQKSEKKGLQEEQIRELEKIGMIWSAKPGKISANHKNGWIDKNISYYKREEQ